MNVVDCGVCEGTGHLLAVIGGKRIKIYTVEHSFVFLKRLATSECPACRGRGWNPWKPLKLTTPDTE